MEILLDQNYRSSPEIVQCGCAIINASKSVCHVLLSIISQCRSPTASAICGRPTARQRRLCSGSSRLCSAQSHMLTDFHGGVCARGLPHHERNRAHLSSERRFPSSNAVVAVLSLAGRLTLNDFSVLIRVNAASREIEEVHNIAVFGKCPTHAAQSFVQFGLPHRLIGTVRFFDRAEIKDILSYVRMVYNPLDTVSFERVINVPKVAAFSCVD